SWARSRRPRRPRPKRRRRRLLPRRHLRRRQRRWRRSFRSDEPRGSQGLLDEAADLAGPEEAHVPAGVPRHLGPFPVLPEAAGLARRRHAIADAGEEEAAVAFGLGLEDERRDDAVHGRCLGAEGAVLERAPSHLQWAVTPV